MNRLQGKKIICSLIILGMALTNFGAVIDTAFAASDPLEVSIPSKSNLKTLNALIPVWTESSLFAAYAGGSRELDIKGKDKKIIDQYVEYIKKIEDTGNVYIAEGKPNTQSVVYNKNYLVPRAYALSSDFLSQFKEPDAKFDPKITTLIDYLLSPKLIFGDNKGGEEQDRIKIEKWFQKDELSKENVLAEKRDTKNPVSSHYYKNNQAIQIAEMDYIKCTEIKRNDKTCQIDDKKALKPIPIDFGDQVESQSGAFGIGNNILKQFNNNFHNFFKNIANNFLEQILSKAADVQTDAMKNYIPEFPESGPNMLSEIGKKIISEETSLPFDIGYDFSNTIEKNGQETLFKLFNEIIPKEAFAGTTAEEWQKNIGRETISEKIFGKSGYIYGDNSEDILTNIGKKKFEEIFGVIAGTLSKKITNPDELIIYLGEGVLEQRLNLKPESFAPDNTNEIKNRIGDEKYKLIFDDSKLAAKMLGISNDDLISNLNNPLALKKIIGQKLLEQNVKIYGEYSIPGTNDKISSLDMAFNTENYLKPSVNLTANKITTYRFTPNKGIETTEYPDAVNANLYSSLLKPLQENSLAKRFLSGQDLGKVFKETGIDALAKTLTNIPEEQEYIRQWLTSDSKSIPKDDKGDYLLNTETLGRNFGLTDRYDLARIFVDNRAYEIFDRLGQSQLSLAMNPSSQDFIGNPITEDFNKTIFDQIEDIAKQLPDPAKGDILSYISTIKTLANNSKEDVILDRQNRQTSSLLYNIGHVILVNNLKNNPVAQQVLEKIDAVITQKETQPIKNLARQLGSNLEINLAQKDVDDFFNQDNNKINIDIFKQRLGKATIASILEEPNSATKNIEDVLKLLDTPKAITALYEKLKNQFDEIADTFNKAVENNGADLLNGWDMASILSGSQNYLISKIAAPKIAYGLETDSAHLMKMIREEDNDFIYNLDLRRIIDGADNLDDAVFNEVQNLLKALGSSNYQESMWDIGMVLSSNFFSIPFPDIGNNELISKFNSYAGKIKEIFKAGAQTIENLQGMKEIFESVLGDSTNMLGRIFSGDVLGTMGEYSVIDMINSISNEFGNAGEDIGKLTDQFRTAFGLKSPFGEDLKKFVNENFKGFLDSAGQNMEKLGRDIEKSIGVNLFKEKISQDTAFKLLDVKLHKLNENIPYGMAKSILSGDTAQVADAAKNYALNYFKNAKNIDIPYKDQIIAVLGGNLDIKTILDNPAIQKVFNEQIGKLFPSIAQNVGFEGFPSGLLKAFTGDFGGLQDIVGNEVKKVIASSMDDIIYAQFGSMGEFNDLLTQSTTAQKGLLDILNDPGSKIKDLIDAKKIFEGFKNTAKGMLTGALTGVLSGVDSSLGLPSGTTQMLFSMLFPKLAAQFGLGALMGKFPIPWIGLGFMSKKTEVWCAMDYYPYLDPEIKYDIAFEKEPGKEDPNGLENLKPTVGDNTPVVVTICPQPPPAPPTIAIENHGLGEFKSDANKIKAKLKAAAKFKVTQLVGEVLRVGEANRLDNMEMLPAQIRTQFDENIEPYIGKIDRLFGNVDTSNGGIRIVKTAKDRILDNETMKGVWSNKKYPNVYVSY